jgi:ketol-acid reductoisomerase
MVSIISKMPKYLFRKINTSLYRNMSSEYNKHSINFKEDGVINHEALITNEDYPINKCRGIIQNKTITVLGYGPQGRSQAMNIKDNNLKVILGLRKDGKSWEHAQKDGWIPGIDMFEIDEATSRGRIVKNLLSDSGQIEQWGKVKDNLRMGDTLYFSHGFGIHYHNFTHINPPDDVNVVMVSPKCSGKTVRRHFNNKGFASSYAVYKDFDGEAEEICLALAFLIGNNYVFKTTFEKEVLSDLTGERCVLMGLIQGAFLAQYRVLRENGHSPCEAYHETIDEALQSLYPLINEKGMDWLYSNCSTTAQRGALDWAPRFEEKIKPVIRECYNDVKTDKEVKRVIECNKKPEYRELLDQELDEIRNQEMWNIGGQLREIKKSVAKNKLNNTSRSYRWNGVYFDN